MPVIRAVLDRGGPAPVTTFAGVMALVVGLATVVAAPTAAQDPVVNRDFASEVLGDPWDFSNPEDAPLTDGPPVSLYVTDAGFGDGTFDWTSEGGFLDLHPMTVPGGLPDSRDGRWNPVDADTYTHVSLRLHASDRGPFRVAWFVCTHDYSGCDRWYDFIVEEGWNTLTLPMQQLSDDWTGMLQGIRLASGGPPVRFRLDWLRIHTADAPAEPPTGAPEPKVLVPNPEGDEDFATTVLGNPWDLSDASDVVSLANVRDVRFEGGMLHATNGPPQQDNPHVVLPHGPGVDPARHRLLTVDTSYDGGFSLSFDPGGGMHGRWLFRRADVGPAWVDSRELVTFRTRPRLTYDLAEDRFGPTTEPGDAAWLGSLVTGLRWDANEDPGARSWRLDEIRLAAPHESSGLFEVVWVDPAHRDGTRVDIGVSRIRGEIGSPVATGIVQQPGENRALLDLSDVPPGRRWVWVRATSPDGITTTATATGELVATGRVAGPDRIATGVTLSRLGWPDGTAAAIVASARDFPDALAGVQLADAVDGPLLLTEPDALPTALATELRRLDVEEVVVLGGPRAVAAAVLDQIEDATGARVLRVSGDDRYATAAEVARLAETRWRAAGRAVSDEVVLASGMAFPDALAAGPVVAATATPLLLTAPDRLPASTRDALQSRPDADLVVVGGAAAVSQAVVEAADRSARRISGADRYETARLLAAEAVATGASPTRTVVASGADFPDALGAGAWAARTGEVLVLTAPDRVPDATAAWLGGGDVERALVIGGRVAIAQAVVDAIHALARA